MVLVVGKQERDGFGRWEHGGGIGLQEEPVSRNGLKGGANGGFALVEEVAVEGKVSAEFDELGN